MEKKFCAVVQLFWNIHNFLPPLFRYVQKVPPMTLIVWHFLVFFSSVAQLSGCCCCCCHIDFYPFSHFFALSIFFISNPSMSLAYNSIFLPWLSLFLIYTFPPFLLFVFTVLAVHFHKCVFTQSYITQSCFF